MNPALAMQMNVKQNAQEINSYLKDLQVKQREHTASAADSRRHDCSRPLTQLALTRRPAVCRLCLQSWSSDVKKKDAALKSGELTLTKTPIAPIRGSAAAAGSGTSFSASKATPVLLPSSASADQRRFAESKAAGNKAFAAGAFEESLSHYATCMILDPTDAIVPSNRAQALLKLQRWHEAEVDATTALSIDSTAVKALFRRAQARRHLRKFAGSLSDCQMLAKLDPTNKAAQALAVEVEALLKKQQEAKLKASQPIVSASPVAPIAAAAGTKTAPAFTTAAAAAASAAAPGASLPAGRRMVIQEEDDDDDVEEIITPAAAAATAAAATAAAANAATAAKANATTARPTAAPSVAAPSAAPSAAAAAASTASPSKSAASPSAAAASASSAAPSSPAAAAAPSSSSAAAASSGVSLRVPKTAYDFDSAFREIRGDPAAVAAYLALLPSPLAAPASYPALLKTALSSTLLREVVEALSAVIVPEGKWSLARDVLTGVAAVPRFATVRMMMDEADKQTLKQLFSSMNTKASQGQIQGTTQEAVQALAKSWGVSL